jgi:hypothetical protein
MTPFGAPSLRIFRVSALVSTPASPIRPFERIHSTKFCAARKLLGALTSWRTTQPKANGSSASRSS